LTNPQGKAIIVSAPSGSGKTTLVRHLTSSNPELGFSISATTRSPRYSEVNGVDYFFLTSDEFQNKIRSGDFVEWEEVYHNAFYGTMQSEIERIWAEGKHVIFDVDVQGGMNLKKYFGDDGLAIFVKAPSEAVLIERLKRRGTETVDALEKRIEKARFEDTFSGQFDHVIINNRLEEASRQIQDLYLAFLK